jgi:energy-coupling factor transport system substrate-specific component
MALSYWISGLSFDLVHCAGNFVLTLVLFKPLYTVMEKLVAGMKKC